MKKKSEHGPALCVLLEGGDSISRELESDRVLKKLREEYPAIEELRYDWGSEPFAAFAGQCQTPSLFSSQRLALINHVESLDSDALALLSQVVDADLPDIYLVMIALEAEEPKKRSSKSASSAAGFAEFRKKIQQKATRLPERVSYHDFPKPPDYKIAAWLVAQTQTLFNRVLTSANAELLAELIGFDIDLLYSELKKIDLVLPAGKAIDQQAIMRFAGISREANPFELAQALGRKDAAAALRIVDNLYAHSTGGPFFISILYKQFWTFYKVLLFAKKNREKVQKYLRPPSSFSAKKQIQEEVGLAVGVFAGLLTENQRGRVFPMVIKDQLIEHALAFKEEHYHKIFHLLADYDRGIKTGKVEDCKMSMQFLCYKIARIDKLSSFDLGSPQAGAA